ncbi:MAG: hypothetical protein D6679_01705 [Candidatus Hydrogenedentota bacterium]|nr:MAG: hypothetical protein D6679_01705 [Candidatus Hydrogenedentota bacterium]
MPALPGYSVLTILEIPTKFSTPAPKRNFSGKKNKLDIPSAENLDSVLRFGESGNFVGISIEVPEPRR